MADLIDNSIDAGATHVLIRFYRAGAQLTGLAVVDDGGGMTEAELDEAMRFGSRTKKTPADLGKYGMGLKSASLNHANSLTVITRRRRGVHARRWTTASIRAGWKLETIDPGDARSVLDEDWGGTKIMPPGTVVLWRDIPRFAATAGHAGVRFGQYGRTLVNHLGLHFHRFLDDGRLIIQVDLRDEETGETGFPKTISPLNPFPDRSPRRGYPATFHAELPAYGELSFVGTIWPARSNDPRYKLGGKVAQRQGFYFYRNDRLIQAGGWNGWRDDAEPHASLARVEVDLPPRFDDAFAISVQKSGVDAPPGFTEAIDAARSGKTTMGEYIREAIDVYRSALQGQAASRPVIGSGLTKSLRKALDDALLDDGQTSVNVTVRWGRLPRDRLFTVEGESREVVLNDRYRHDILGGRKASSGDAPLFKTLIFLLLSDDAVRERRSKKAEARWNTINECLLAALREGP